MNVVHFSGQPCWYTAVLCTAGASSCHDYAPVTFTTHVSWHGSYPRVTSTSVHQWTPQHDASLQRTVQPTLWSLWSNATNAWTGNTSIKFRYVFFSCHIRCASQGLLQVSALNLTLLAIAPLLWIKHCFFVCVICCVLSVSVINFLDASFMYTVISQELCSLCVLLNLRSYVLYVYCQT